MESGSLESFFTQGNVRSKSLEMQPLPCSRAANRAIADTLSGVLTRFVAVDPAPMTE
jgi:hypothetical protein